MSEVLIKLTGLWERERRGNLGNTYWVSRLWHREKSWYSRTIARKGNPDFNVCDRTVPPAGAPLALLAAMAGVVRPPRLAPSMLQPCSRRREKTWHEMIRAVLRGGPLSGEPPKFKAAANMRSSR